MGSRLCLVVGVFGWLTITSSAAARDVPIALERALAADEPCFAPTPLADGLALGETGARFDTRGAHVPLGSHVLTLRVAAIGRGPVVRALSADVAPTAYGAEVRYARSADVVEWWRALRPGLEHGVTLARRPAGVGALVLSLAVAGDLSFATDDAGSLRVVDADGETVGRYGGLVVIDARGREIPARLRGRGAAARIEVDDADAVYPLVVDPILGVEATLTTAGDVSGGTSVAISTDGMRAVVGAPRTTVGGFASAGLARVYVRTGVTWALEATLQLTTGLAANLECGVSVAIDDGGNVVAIGCPGQGNGAGAVATFARTGGTWAAPRLVGSNPTAIGYRFGQLVALSGDGNYLFGALQCTAAVCGTVSRVQVFLRNGSGVYTWDDGLGTSLGDTPVALAVDGTGQRAVVGYGTGNGIARIWTRATPTWTLEGTLMPSVALAGGDSWGAAVAITRDGTRALVGMPGEDLGTNVDAGIVYVFVRATTTWSIEGTISGPAMVGGERFGAAVAVTDDGARAVIGAPFADTSGANRGAVYVATRGGTAWTNEPTDPLSGCAGSGAGMALAGSAVATTGNGTRALLGAPNVTTTAAGLACVWALVGNACTTGSQCARGFCVDGTCCESACSTSTSDCAACSMALTGLADGRCGPLGAAAAAATTCRASAGGCDVAESCAAGSMTCPPDVLAAAGATCRASLGACDPAEVCSGTSAACPSDVLATGTPCRPPAGMCDTAEMCDGASPTCPPDAFSAGVVCRSAMGACDLEETCTGTSAACPADAFRSMGTVCLAAMAGNTCDVDDVCTGTSAECAPRFAPSTVVCRPAGTGVCDAPDVCAGTSADCIDTFTRDVVCRPSTGGCDGAETCSGASPDCPADQLEPAGMTCRPSTGTCDPAETCDGLVGACPADLTSCRDTGIAPDAAVLRDAGSALDGSTAPDVGTSPPAASGCACRAGARSREGASGTWSALALAAAVVWRRRRSTTR